MEKGIKDLRKGAGGKGKGGEVERFFVVVKIRKK